MGRLKDSRSFWRGRKVLITGYEGFLGSWLTKRLLEYGADITGFDIVTGRKQTILNKDDFNRIKVVRGNVKNYRLVHSLIKSRNIETVFHLAAQALVGRAQNKPLVTFKSNIEGSWNILEACRNASSVKEVIVSSSDKAYGSHEKLPYFEDLALCGRHPYDVSKSCKDLLAQSYFHTYNLGVCVVRCGNIYGGGDFHFSRVVPDAILSILKDKKFFIRSDGKFIRDYVYVEDIVKGYIAVAEKMGSLKLWGQAFNLGNELPVSVLELVELLYKLADKKPDYEVLDKVKYEIKEQYLSSKKAKEALGWEPQYPLAEGLKKTIAWYRKFL